MSQGATAEQSKTYQQLAGIQTGLARNYEPTIVNSMGTTNYSASTLTNR